MSKLDTRSNQNIERTRCCCWQFVFVLIIYSSEIFNRFFFKSFFLVTLSLRATHVRMSVTVAVSLHSMSNANIRIDTVVPLNLNVNLYFRDASTHHWFSTWNRTRTRREKSNNHLIQRNNRNQNNRNNKQKQQIILFLFTGFVFSCAPLFYLCVCCFCYSVGP